MDKNTRFLGVTRDIGLRADSKMTNGREIWIRPPARFEANWPAAVTIAFGVNPNDLLSSDSPGQPPLVTPLNRSTLFSQRLVSARTLLFNSSRAWTINIQFLYLTIEPPEYLLGLVILQIHAWIVDGGELEQFTRRRSVLSTILSDNIDTPLELPIAPPWTGSTGDCHRIGWRYEFGLTG